MEQNQILSQEKLAVLNKLREQEISLNMQGRAVEEIVAKLTKAFDHPTPVKPVDHKSVKHILRQIIEPDIISVASTENGSVEDLSSSQRKLEIIRENRAIAMQRRVIEHAEALQQMELMRQQAIEQARKEATDEMTARFFFVRRSTLVFRILHALVQRSDRAYVADEKGRRMLLGKAINVIHHRASILAQQRALTINADMKLRFDKLVTTFHQMLTYKLRSYQQRKAYMKANLLLLRKSFTRLYQFKNRSVRYFEAAARSRYKKLSKGLVELKTFVTRLSVSDQAYQRGAQFHAMRKIKLQLELRLRARILDIKRKHVADLYRVKKWFKRFLRYMARRFQQKFVTRPKVVKYYRLITLQKAFYKLISRLRRRMVRRLLVKKNRSRVLLLKATDVFHALSSNAKRNIRAKRVAYQDYLKKGLIVLNALHENKVEKQRFIDNMKSGITYSYMRSVSEMLNIWKHYTYKKVHYEHRDKRMPIVRMRRLALKCFRFWIEFCDEAHARRYELAQKLKFMERRQLRQGFDALIQFSQHCVDARTLIHVAKEKRKSIKASTQLSFLRNIQQRIRDRHDYELGRTFYYSSKVGRALQLWIQHTSNEAALLYLKNVKLNIAREKNFLKRWMTYTESVYHRRAYLRTIDKAYGRNKVKIAFQFLVHEHKRRAEETHYVRAFRAAVMYPMWQKRFLTELSDRIHRKHALNNDPRKCRYQARKLLRQWHSYANNAIYHKKQVRAAKRYAGSLAFHPFVKHMVQRTAYCHYAKVVYTMAISHRTRLGWEIWKKAIFRKIGLKKMQRHKVVRSYRRQTTLYRYLFYLHSHLMHMKIYRENKKHATFLRNFTLKSLAFRGLKQDYNLLQRTLVIPIRLFKHHAKKRAINDLRYLVASRRLYRSAIHYERHSKLKDALWHGIVERHLLVSSMKLNMQKSKRHHKHHILLECLRHWIWRVDDRRRLKQKERRESLKRQPSMSGRRDSLTGRDSVTLSTLTSSNKLRSKMANPCHTVVCHRAVTYLHDFAVLQKYYQHILNNVKNTHKDFLVSSAFKNWRKRTATTIRHRKTIQEVHLHIHRIKVNDLFPILMSMIAVRKAEQFAKEFYVQKIVKTAWKTLKKRANIGVKRVKHQVIKSRSRSKSSIYFAEPVVQETIHEIRRRGSFKPTPAQLQQHEDGDKSEIDGAIPVEEVDDSDEASSLHGLMIQTGTPGASNSYMNSLFPSVSVKSDLSVTSEVEEVEYYVEQAGDFRIRKQKQWVKQAEKTRINRMKHRFFYRLHEMAFWHHHVRDIVRAQRIKRYKRIVRRIRNEAVVRKYSRSVMRKAKAINLFLYFKRFVIRIVEVRHENRSIRRRDRKMLTIRFNAWIFYVQQLKAARIVQEFVRGNVDYHNKRNAFTEWAKFAFDDKKAEKFYNSAMKRHSVECFTTLFMHGKNVRRQRYQLVKAVKYHTKLIRKHTMKVLLAMYRKRLSMRKKIVVGLMHVRYHRLVHVLRLLRHHAKRRQIHRKMQQSLRYEILTVYFRRAMSWTRQMALKHIGKQLQASMAEKREKRMQVAKTLNKISTRNAKIANFGYWKHHVKVQKRLAKLLMRAVIHHNRYGVAISFRRLLSYCRMRRLKRKNIVKLLMMQRKQVLRRVISKLDMNSMYRFSKAEEHRLWLIEEEKKALARGFLKVLACRKRKTLHKAT